MTLLASKFLSALFLLLINILWIPLNARRTTHQNIILFITDDQDIELGSMQFMPKTMHLMNDRGVSFDSGFVSTPICCPSRTSILTGMYVHNHNVLTNNQNCSSTAWRHNLEKKTFAVYAKKAGYRTAYFGKYLNEYDGSYIPPGWDHWMGLIKNSRFYNYTINFNGEKIKHGFDYEKDYFTDLITNDTIQFIHDHYERRYPKPFLVILSFPAPHGPEDPAPQYSDWFQDVETHRTLSWNYAPNPDKQWLLQHTGRMEPIHVVFTDVLHRRRLQTLQSVDHNVQRLFNELRDLGELSSTYFIYTSDHGYHLGQFGLVKGKNMPYEFDIRVPFYIRGPGLPKNLSIKVPVMNIDIAPTILDMAGIEQPIHMDGRSLMPLIQSYSSSKRKIETKDVNLLAWRHTVLIERGKMAKLTRIRERLLKQRDRFDKDKRVQTACKRPEFSEPCSPYQEWKCTKNESNKWKIFKCHEEVEIFTECVCDNRSRRRQNRSTKRLKRKISFRQIVTIAELDQSHKTVKISENLTSQWENEFLHYIQQKEITESGQWFQGIFDVDSEVRAKRSTRKSQSKKKIERELNIGPMCMQSNTTILCEPIVFEDSRLWAIQKTKVDDRIETLRRKLSAFKNVRKVLKRGRPDENNIEYVNTSRSCRCSEFHANPIRKMTNEESGNQTLRKENAANTKKWLRADTKKNCNVPQMNCFVHYADHWRTPPLWPALYGEFCFCQNSNNNTYWCLRTINETHNFLYCEFITEFISYYNLKEDPYQLHNSIWSIPVGVLEQLSKQLSFLRKCKGWKECEHYSSPSWNTKFTEFGN